MKLRDYQNECIDILDKKGQGRWLVQMATGLGKTVTFANLKRKGRMLILSHREELVRQPLKYFDCSTGIEMAGEDKSNGEEVVSASVQSLGRRLDRFKEDDFDIIVVDEAHHSAAPSYRKILDYFKPRQVIGFTATPNRADKVRLNDVYDEIVYQKNLLWGIKNGYLSDIECKRANIGYDIRKVKTSCGDYAQDELAKAMDGTEKAIGEAYKKLAKGATLVFASSVDHANNIAKYIPDSVVVTGKTENRAEIVQAFADRKIPCLINCMVFTEGTDLPLVETVIIARPTKSESLYTQMVGRGLRLAEGKDKLRLIDCVGVSDDKSLCTAPSLLGIDIHGLSKKKQDTIEGDLLELKGKIDRLADSPAMWINSIEDVDLWSREQHYDLHGVNYCRMPDGTLICNVPNSNSFVIPCPDMMGNITFKNGKVYPAQQVYDMVYDILKKKHADCKIIWDKKKTLKWGYEPATDKQVKLIRDKLRRGLDEIDFKTLTKLQAYQIITRMMYGKGG